MWLSVCRRSRYMSVYNMQKPSLLAPDVTHSAQWTKNKKREAKKKQPQYECSAYYNDDYSFIVQYATVSFLSWHEDMSVELVSTYAVRTPTLNSNAQLCVRGKIRFECETLNNPYTRLRTSTIHITHNKSHEEWALISARIIAAVSDNFRIRLFLSISIERCSIWINQADMPAISSDSQAAACIKFALAQYVKKQPRICHSMMR